MSFLSPHHQVVEFAGADALAFLQSQLTNDVAALSVGAWQWQGYCNSKGRLHATFALVRTGEQTYLAVVHESVIAFLVKRLTMFRLRSKLSIATNADLVVVHHFAAPAASESVIATLNLQHGRWVTIEAKNSNQLNDPSPNELAQWQMIGIESEQPEIVELTNEMFVPQMIAFDVIAPNGGVSFSKGCYPGQEVVARAHYRGAVKRELLVKNFVAPPDGALAPGMSVDLESGETVDVVNAVQTEDGWRALIDARVMRRSKLRNRLISHSFASEIC
jgi:tRNA-modifying protein YgfZ